MTYIKPNENFYDLLKVSPRATVAEIVTAYHTAKNAFSKDSIATYSLFSPEDAQKMLDRLEEAYLTLSNFEKRTAYDRKRAETNLAEEENKTTADADPKLNDPPLTSEKEEPKQKALPIQNESSGQQPNDVLNGAVLRKIREERKLSIEDVARITKIPTRFIRALEADDAKQLPARVYIQGFIKNLASLYRLEPQSALKAYLSRLDLGP